MVPLPCAPSEVHPSTTSIGRPGDIDLFPMVLPDVGDPQVGGLSIEAEPPRVAEPDRPDLGTGSSDGDEGVVGRHGVRPIARVRVDAQDLAKPLTEVESP